MENRFGVKGTIYDSIFFTEAKIPGAILLEHIHIEISRQNSNLYEVKAEMASKAKTLEATAIMNFRYGQKKHSVLDLIFTLKWDTESWHGEGDAVKI